MFAATYLHVTIDVPPGACENAWQTVLGATPTAQQQSTTRYRSCACAIHRIHQYVHNDQLVTESNLHTTRLRNVMYFILL